MGELSKRFLEEVKDFSIDVAQRAGKVLLLNQKKINRLTVSHKDALGVVSSADLKSEKLIIEKIKKRFKGHEILAEESTYFENKNKARSYEYFKEIPWSWIIDPLDGTHNYLNGSDYYAVCIGLAYYGDPVVLSLIHI